MGRDSRSKKSLQFAKILLGRLKFFPRLRANRQAG